jgi:hypothetical protein
LRQLFRLNIIFLLIAISAALIAQDDLDINPSKKDKSSLPTPEEKSEVKLKRSRRTKLNLDDVKREFEPAPKEDVVPRNLQAEHWSRFTGGLWLSISNEGIARPLLKISQDNLLMNKSTERVWGFGGQLDFSFDENPDQAIRTRVGVMRSILTPQSSVSSGLGGASLENRINIFNMSVLHRWKYMVIPEAGHMWFGWGGQMNYAYSTSRTKQSSGTPRSKLSNSYAFNLVLAMGSDFPITDLEDISFEFQYLPSKGMALLFGFRSSL